MANYIVAAIVVALAFGLFLAIGYIGCASYLKYYSGPVSNHFDGKRFFDPNSPNQAGCAFSAILRWRLTSRPKPWPKKLENQLMDIPPARVEGGELRISFVGHATMLIQTAGLNILTDPLWSERASPFSWMGPKRVISPGIDFENLPKIDLVLISHNHYDHLDIPTIRRLWKEHKPKIIVPLGNDAVIRSYDKQIQVKCYDWEDQISITDGVTLSLEPMQHWSARGIFDKNKALWAAYVLDTPGGKIYFAGDTGYGEGEYFRQIQKKHGRFRLAILPIGAYEPRWFMQKVHISPKEAVLAYQDLNASFAVAHHFGTFQLADDGYDDPIINLKRALADQEITADRFLTMKVGEHFFVPMEK
ncbi:membrane protein [Rickettsiales bacterium]|nr:membrane protein [Rickettsiales bacterium]